jgi:hypothetical protein
VIIFALLVAGVYVAFLAWNQLEGRFQRSNYRHALNDARELQRTLRGKQGLSDFSSEYSTARASLRSAEEAAGADKWTLAVRSAERGRSLLAAILSNLERAEANGQAQFISVTSEVEYKRGERSNWQRAFNRGVLYAGDYVKTGDGSAEIMGVDGTVYTVRSDTVILIGRTTGLGGKSTRRSISLNHGWVNLSTARAASTVETPDARAEVNEASSALVAYDGTRRVGRFATYDGSMDIASSAGQRRNLKKLEQVVQTGRTLSETRRLPAAPLPIDPSDNLEVRLDESDRLVLSWQPVPGARRYALQVARNRLFVRNIIDVDDRPSTSATLGLQGDGTFVWRVAAIADGGVVGPWSTARRFRISPAIPVLEPDELPLETEPAAAVGSF